MRLVTVRWRWDRVPLWEAMFAYRALAAVAVVTFEADGGWRITWP